MFEGGKVFVAGASGMAGRAIVDHLLERGVDLVASYYSQQCPWEANSGLRTVQVDLRNAEECKRAMEGCEALVMAAAVTGGSVQQNSQPWLQINDNLSMNAGILQAACTGGVKKIVLIGSATSYQDFSGSIKEEDLDWAQDPPAAYLGIGWVSRYLEKLAYFWHKKCSVEILCVRAANIYGPFAKFDPSVSNFIPALIRKAVDRFDPYEVWGSPAVIRDVIFSGDFAHYIAELLFLGQRGFDVFNVGSSAGATVDEVVKCILSASRYTCANIQYTDKGPTTVKSRILDCSKLNKAVPSKPSCDLAHGITKTTHWWINNKDNWMK